MQSKRSEPNSEARRSAKCFPASFGYFFQLLTGRVTGTTKVRYLICAGLVISAFSGLARSVKAQRGYAFTPGIGVGVTSAPQMVSVTMKQAGTVSSIQVLTGGSSGLDYAPASASGAGLCSTGTAYGVGQSCMVPVTFTAKFPGLRSGAVVLLDGSGAAMATTLLSGLGVGPLSVATAGEIVTVAGDGHLATGITPGIQATMVGIHEPLGVAVDGAGNFYYTDNGNNLIGKVDENGVLTDIAGTQNPGFSPNGTPASAAQISGPSAILVDGAGNVYFTEQGNSTVREIVKATGLIETVAGTGTQGYSGDGGPATAAMLNQPEGIAFDLNGNLYISDSGNNVIRRISAVDGTINTVAGTGASGYAGDSGPASAALLAEPWGITFGPDGSLYIADFLNNVIRKVDNAGVISTIAGTGVEGYLGDGGQGSAATLDHPASVAVDAGGNIFISDSENNVVRKINGATKIITTLAGNAASGSTGDGGDANLITVSMNKTYGLCLDGAGDLFVSDRLGLQIREIYAAVGRIQFKDIKVTNTSPAAVQPIDNNGNAPLHISSITAISNALVDTATTTCSTTAALAPGAQCNVGVDFKPETVGSPVNGQVNVNSDSANTPLVIDLYGNSLSIEPTTTTLTSTPNPSAFGQSVTFTATISSQYTGQLRGSVQFIDTSLANAVIGNAAVNSTTRVATISVSNLALGVHQITAVFTDTDANNTNSTSMPYTQTVKQAVALALTAMPNPAHVYDTVTFTVVASETPAGGTVPTGAVTFTDSVTGSTLTGTSVPLVNGSASFSTATLASGTHNITAAYAGDSTNAAATSNMVAEVITAATSTTTLTTSNPNVPLETLVTFTASVAGNSASIPTGNVVFKDGTATIGTVAVTNTGTATLPIASLTTGVHMITAAYQGDMDYAGSVSAPPLSETVNKIATSTVVVSSTSAANAGATVTFTVTVTAATSTTPNLPITGSVSLMDGTTVVGTGTVSPLGSGPATASVVIPVTSLGAGGHTITAVYAGDTNYTGSNSGSIPETISLASSSALLAASSTTPIATTPVTLTATLTSNGGTPTGSVSFLDGGTAIGTGVLAKGVATLTTSTLAVGPHTITAVYGGDADDSASTSNAVTITVVARTTTVTLASSQNPLLTLSPVTITATIADGGGTTPKGTVSFAQDGTAVSTVPVSATGTATLQVAALPAGSHAFVATYSGDSVDSPSASAPLSEVVQLRGTTDALTTSATSLTGGQQITLISIVRWTGPATPTGTITFFNGTYPLATAAVDATGVGTVTVLLSGTSVSLSSMYSGDASYAPSTSAAETVTIGPAANFSMTADPATFTLVSKQHMTLNLSIASLKEFTDTLSLGCLGLPQDATCSFSKDQMLLPAGGTMSLTLTVDTGNPLLAGPQAKNESPLAPRIVMACLLPGGLLLGLVGVRFRKVKGVGGLMLLLVLAALSTVVMGCGTVNALGTPAGTYHFNLSATGKTGVSQSLPLTMTVTQ